MIRSTRIRTGKFHPTLSHQMQILTQKQIIPKQQGEAFKERPEATLHHEQS